MGEKTLVFISPMFYNDDKWHTIEASRVGKESLLKIDGDVISMGECTGTSADLQVIIVFFVFFFENSVEYFRLISNSGGGGNTKNPIL